MDNSSRDELRQALAALAHAQMQHLNRLLACEAVLLRLIPMLDPPVLRRLSDEFGEARVRAMHQLIPEQQDASVWASMQQAIDEALVHREGQAPDAPA